MATKLVQTNLRARKSTDPISLTTN